MMKAPRPSITAIAAAALALHAAPSRARAPRLPVADSTQQGPPAPRSTPPATAPATASTSSAAPAVLGAPQIPTAPPLTASPPSPPGQSSEPAPPGPSPSAAADPRFAQLAPLTFRALNTREQVTVRVYRDDGTVDPEALAALSHLFRDLSTGAPSPVVPRTLQLLARVAGHFQGTQFDVVSAYRTGLSASGRRVRTEGYHGVGSAVDFRLQGTDCAHVAAYGRTFAHVGVGYYPRENFVHLDSREQSFFWENRSGRGHHGWNRPLDRTGAAERDAGWTAEDDAPWDRPGVAVALVLHPRTQPGAHRPRHHAHGRRRRPLHVFRGDE